MLTKSHTQSFVAGLDPPIHAFFHLMERRAKTWVAETSPATNEKLAAGGDAGRLLRRSGPKLWCHLAHEESEAAGRCFVRQRAEAEARDHAADAECGGFGNRLCDPSRSAEVSPS